jgi:hypothetical protein
MSRYSNPALANQLREFMTSKGLPSHVAEGFLMNYQDESGFNPGINERNPSTPGSRGGFGLYQLTGPRRAAFEGWAGSNGRNLSDPLAQAEFQMMELAGPERRAMSRIMQTNTPGEAAAAIATHFLRPSREHLDRRVARYTGQGNSNVYMSTRSAPQNQVPEEQRRRSVIQHLMSGDFSGAGGAIRQNANEMFSGDQSAGMPGVERLAGRSQQMADLAKSSTEGMGGPGPAHWSQALASGLAGIQSHRLGNQASQMQSQNNSQVAELLKQPLTQETIAMINELDPQLGRQLLMNNVQFGQQMQRDELGHERNLELVDAKAQSDAWLASLKPEQRTALMQNAQAAGFTPGTPEYHQFIREHMERENRKTGTEMFIAPDGTITFRQGDGVAGSTPGSGATVEGTAGMGGEDGTAPGGEAGEEGETSVPMEGGAGQPGRITQVGKPQEGQIQHIDPETQRLVQTTIEGSRFDRAQKEEARAALERAINRDQAYSIVLDRVQDARRIAQNPWATGWRGQVLRNLGGTDARALQARTDTILANLGFERLQQMREESPTGGALGQVAVREIELLQATIANLDQAQSQEEFMRELDYLQDIMTTVLLRNDRNRRRLSGEEMPEQGHNPDPNFEIGKIYEGEGGNRAMWTEFGWRLMR